MFLASKNALEVMWVTRLELDQSSPTLDFTHLTLVSGDTYGVENEKDLWWKLSSAMGYLVLKGIKIVSNSVNKMTKSVKMCQNCVKRCKQMSKSFKRYQNCLAKSNFDHLHVVHYLQTQEIIHLVKQML